MGRLQDKVAIVTGGNSGVGAATALLFAREGAKVIISARRKPQLEEVAEKIREAGGEVLPVVTDISKPEDADNLISKTIEAYGKVDILINSAGVLERMRIWTASLISIPRERCIVCALQAIKWQRPAAVPLSMWLPLQVLWAAEGRHMWHQRLQLSVLHAIRHFDLPVQVFAVTQFVREPL